jgi:uncharacterized protein (TIGR03437 family)
VRYLFFLSVFIQLLPAQQAIRVSNAASLGFGSAPANSFAPGSLIEVDLSLVAITGAIVPIDPTTVTIQIQPAGSAAVVGSANGFGVVARLSNDIPLGATTLTMTFNGQTSTPAQISIVPSSFGLFTRGNGGGPVLAQNALTKPARPGDFVTLWGTGLGAANQDRVSVLLGGHVFPVSYAGPAPGFPGTDQINFQLPDDRSIPYGCYVAVALKIENYTSNIGMLSTVRDTQACQSPFGFTAAQMAQLDAGQSLYLGQVNLYDMVGKPVSQWFDVTGFARQESADASFLSLDGTNVASLTDPLQAADAYYSCYVSTVAGARFIGTSGALNAGDKLVLSSGSTAFDLPLANPQTPSFYRMQLPVPSPVSSPDGVSAPFFKPGVWQVSSSGSADVQPFTGRLTVPPAVRISNAADLTSFDRTKDLTVQWNGSDYTDDYVATVQLAASSTVVCRAAANAGQLTIPAALMQGITQGANGTGLELLLTPKPDRVTTFNLPLVKGGTAPAMFRYYPSESVPVQIH